MTALIESKPEDFEPFKIEELNKYRTRCGYTEVPRKLRAEPTITATFHPVTVRKIVRSDIKRGISAVVYTNVKSSRPWLGIIQETSERSVNIHWLKKEKSKYVPHFLSNGAPDQSEIPIESIMFVDILLNLSPLVDDNGPFALEQDLKLQIMSAYKDQDEDIPIGEEDSVNPFSSVVDEFSDCQENYFPQTKRKFISVQNPFK